MRSINFSQENLAVQWQYVKRNLHELGIEGFLDDFEQKAHKVVRELIQRTIYEEFDEQIGACRYEHARGIRRDTRKGHYERFLSTTFGLSKVVIPRTRDGFNIHYSLFNKYQRRRDKLDRMILYSMILGLSTRKQKRFFKAFIGDAVSHATASRLLRGLEGSLNGFRTKPIDDSYKYLLIDGLWVKVRSGERLRKMVILFVLGITPDNKKEIIAFRLAKGETEEEVTVLLNDLYRRGLEGKNTKLIASDGAKGIRAAINTVYPYAQWQLCHVHKLRNLASNIRHKKKHRRKLMRQARNIYKAKTRRQAIKRFNRFRDRWQDKEGHAVQCFSKDFYDSILYYDFVDDANLISTTNHLERDLEEVRRRIKIQGYFKNERSLNLWIYGIISQFRVDDNREAKPNCIFTLIKEAKYKSVQLS